MVRGCKLERESIACPRPTTSTRPLHPHHSSSSSCSLLTAPSHTRSEGSPMLAGLPLSRSAPAVPASPPPAPSPGPGAPQCPCCACYPRLVARHPWLLLLGVFLVSSAALIALVAVGEWPDFTSSAREAFITVDTRLSRRYEQFRQLLSRTSAEYEPPRHNRTRRSLAGHPCMRSIEVLHNVHRLSRLVVAARAPVADLLTVAGLRSQCRVEARLRNLSGFVSVCGSRAVGDCCPLWSLALVATRLGGGASCGFGGASCGSGSASCASDDASCGSGGASCDAVIERQVNTTRRLVRLCLPAYRRHPTKTCWLHGGRDCTLPGPCRAKADLLFLLFHVLLPQRGLQPRHLRVARSLVVLPVPLREPSLQLYRQLREERFLAAAAPGVAVEGVYFGLAERLIDEVLRRDSRWLALGAGAIFLLVWASTGSLLVTAMAHLLMVLSLLLGYAVYTLLFQLRHFPFVNMMAAVLAIAIGADDVFIYSRVWTAAKSDRRDATLTRLVADSLRHAGASILVTSLSTGAALFANACSRIVAVKCFAVYAGVVVLVNLLLVLACIPATWVIVERRSLWPCRAPPAWLTAAQRAIHSRVFVDALPGLVVRGRHVWAALGVCLTAAALVLIFYRPGFSFSRSLEPVFFSGRHPSQLYLNKQAALFDFERQFRRKHKFILRFVWGAKPSDRRDPFSISGSAAPFVPDPQFNPDSFAAQKWLHNLCNKLHTAPRAVPTDPGTDFSGSHLQLACPFSDTVTSFTTYAEYISCRNKTLPTTASSGCCWRDHPFPYSRRDFHRCLSRYSTERSKLRLSRALRFHGSGPAMDSGRPLLAGLLLQVATNVSRAAPYTEMASWLAAVDAWWRAEMRKAPAGLRGGFVTSDFHRFDLHRDIATSLPLTVGLSVGVAALVCLVTSLNPLLAGLALVTAVGILASTVATFIVVGWALDIVEAVVMTLAVGLAVDNCLHLGVAYRVARVPSHLASRPGERRGRAREALVSVGSPITAAAVTTALAGVGMLPTQLLVYRQMALFLIVLMAWAWFFSVFVFVSLLALLGPSYACAQASCPRACLQAADACSCGLDHVDKTVYSEPELSTGTLRMETLASDDMEPTTLSLSYSNHALINHLHAGATPEREQPPPRLSASTNDIWVKRSGDRQHPVARPTPNSYESLSNV